MTINPEILAATIAVFLLTAGIVAWLAYRYGFACRADPGGRQRMEHDTHAGSSPVGAPPIQPDPVAESSAEWIETEAVIINPLQARITVSVVALPPRE